MQEYFYKNGSCALKICATKGVHPKPGVQLRSNIVICRTFLVKPRNQRIDCEGLRRNFVREMHDHSALHRMLLFYEKMEFSTAAIWDSLLVATQRKGVGPGPNLGN